MVSPMSLSLIAAGASGIEVEVHNNPEKACSDGPQSLYPQQFEKLMRDIEALCPVIGKTLEKTPRIIPESIKEESADLTTSSQEREVHFQSLPPDVSSRRTLRFSLAIHSKMPSILFLLEKRSSVSYL